MNAADDVREMESITNQIADRLVGIGAQLQVRVSAVTRLFNAGTAVFSGNRVFEFLKGRAKRVDAWERDYAARQLHDLKERERAERDAAHFAWLEGEIARHRVSGTEHRGAHVVALEHLLRVARAEAGVPAEDHDQSREWGGSEAAE